MIGLSLIEVIFLIWLLVLSLVIFYLNVVIVFIMVDDFVEIILYL